MSSEGSDAPMVPKGSRRGRGLGGGPGPARLREFRRGGVTGGGAGGGGRPGPARPGPDRPGPAPAPARPGTLFFRVAMAELCAVLREAPAAFDSTVKHAHANINQLNSHT